MIEKIIPRERFVDKLIAAKAKKITAMVLVYHLVGDLPKKLKRNILY